MDDAELQDEPLQIRLMDHDTYSANDAIGKVYLDLNPLLLPPSAATTKTLPETGPASSISLSGGRFKINCFSFLLFFFTIYMITKMKNAILLR